MLVRQFLSILNASNVSMECAKHITTVKPCIIRNSSSIKVRIMFMNQVPFTFVVQAVLSLCIRGARALNREQSFDQFEKVPITAYLLLLSAITSSSQATAFRRHSDGSRANLIPLSSSGKWWRRPSKSYRIHRITELNTICKRAQ